MQNGGQATAAAPAKEGESDASSHKLSKVLGGKDDEDAKEPDIAHELSSSEVFLLHKRIKYASVSCVTLRSNIPLHSLQNAVPAGPWLQYLGQREGRWQGSALLVLPPSKLNMQQQPILTYSAEGM